MIIHGYGQLAQRFIQKFKPFENEYWIVAPEGPHRFYVEGFSGKVGASWMSKEDRLDDIADYLNYLDALMSRIAWNKYKEINVLGFSQGVATAFRWLVHSELDINHFIICSGMIPPDISIDMNVKRFANMKMSYLSGLDDPFKKQAEVEQLLQQLKSNNLNFKEYYFQGGHKINVEQLAVALRRK